jgi:alcohol dehydrogenase
MESIKNVFQGQQGSIKVFEACIDAVRRAGNVSVVGVYGYAYDNFPVQKFFEKNIKMRGGQAWVQNYIDHLISLVAENKVTLDDIITHRVPLTEADKMYDIFNKKEDGCVKVVLKP